MAEQERWSRDAVRERRTVEIGYVLLSSLAVLGVVAATYELAITYLDDPWRTVIAAVTRGALVILVVLLGIRGVRLLVTFEQEVARRR